MDDGLRIIRTVKQKSYLQVNDNKYTSMGDNFTILGTSTHSQNERVENDYYATDPKAGKLLLEIETFSENIWECACGEGHLSKVFINAGYKVKSSDLVNRGFGEIMDFLTANDIWNGDIITNPPYQYAQEFIEKAISIIPNGNKVAMFLKVQFLEGKKRKIMFQKFPPKTIYISSSRLHCPRNGDFETFKNPSVTCYAWYVWQKGFEGTTELKWFN